jgi:hypothetical protein
VALTRIRIEPEVGAPIQTKGDAQVFFNPTQYTLAKKVTWKATPNPGLDLPQLQFERGEARTLALSLLFDTYELRTDVRDLTRKLADLTEVAEGKDRPPFVKIFWGNEVPPHVGLPFTGVVDGLTQKFTLFLDDGTPVRATLDVSIREVESPEKQLKRRPRKRNSPIQARTRVVDHGDTLWLIASAEYGDPGRWRPIADANRIRNPRELEPGTTLLIPSVE